MVYIYIPVPSSPMDPCRAIPITKGKPLEDSLHLQNVRVRKEDMCYTENNHIASHLIGLK